FRSSQVGERAVEDDRPLRALLVGHDVRLARGDVRDVLAVVEVLLGHDAVLDPRLAAHEVAGESRPVRSGYLQPALLRERGLDLPPDRKSTRLNSSHEWISYAVFCLKKKKPTQTQP